MRNTVRKIVFEADSGNTVNIKMIVSKNKTDITERILGEFRQVLNGVFLDEDAAQSDSTLVNSLELDLKRKLLNTQEMEAKKKMAIELEAETWGNRSSQYGIDRAKTIRIPRCLIFLFAILLCLQLLGGILE